MVQIARNGVPENVCVFGVSLSVGVVIYVSRAFRKAQKIIQGIESKTFDAFSYDFKSNLSFAIMRIVFARSAPL